MTESSTSGEEIKIYHGSDYNPELNQGVAIAFGTIGGMIFVLLTSILLFYIHNKFCRKKEDIRAEE